MSLKIENKNQFCQNKSSRKVRRFFTKLNKAINRENLACDLLLASFQFLLPSLGPPVSK